MESVGIPYAAGFSFSFEDAELARLLVSQLVLLASVSLFHCDIFSPNQNK